MVHTVKSLTAVQVSIAERANLHGGERFLGVVHSVKSLQAMQESIAEKANLHGGERILGSKKSFRVAGLCRRAFL